MNEEKLETTQEILRDLASGRPTRREVLVRLAGSASAGVIGCLLTGNLKPVRGQSVAGDLGILTAALYLEHEAIAAYQAGAESKLLSEGVLKAAVAFQSDHKLHRDGISGAIRTLGGEPIEPEKKYSFGPLKSEEDILRLARKLEKGAIDAYSTLAANIQNKDVLNFGAQILTDEVRHLTVLNRVLQIPNY
jgi:hypothetical protein